MAKEKRKGLMAVLSEYQTEKGYGAKTKDKGPVKSGKAYGETLKKNKKEDASGPKVMTPKKKNPPKASKPSKPSKPAKPSKPVKTDAEGVARYSNAKYNPGTGTYGKSLPSNPKLASQSTGKKDPESGIRTGRRAPTSKPKRKSKNRYERRKK